MKPAKAMLIMGLATTVVLAGIAVVNYQIDSMCYYHCDDIDLQKRTTNSFYERALLVGGHADAQAIILGSSRGESTSPLWVKEKTGLKTLNLSVGGADVLLKVALTNLSMERLNLKKVIWLTDYFEIADKVTDVKLQNSKFFRKYLPENFRKPTFQDSLRWLQSLIDHNIFEASLRSHNEPLFDPKNFGSGTNISPEKSSDFVSKEIQINFEFFTRTILKFPQAETYWDAFVGTLHKLSKKNVEVLLVISPYNPIFMKRLSGEFPELYQKHENWVKRVVALKIPHVKILDYSDGFKDDDGGPKYWNDGVHFNSRSATIMLKENL